MYINKRIAAGLVGTFLLLGIMGSHSDSTTAVKSSGDTQPAQTAITPVNHPQVSQTPITLAPTTTPTSTVTPLPTATPKPTTKPTTPPIPTKRIAPIKQQISTPTPIKKQTVESTSNNDYYTNVNGNQVHTPIQADSAPAGATAQCADGSYSFSQNRRGTCSHHGGVAQWL